MPLLQRYPDLKAMVVNQDQFALLVARFEGLLAQHRALEESILEVHDPVMQSDYWKSLGDEHSRVQNELRETYETITDWARGSIFCQDLNMPHFYTYMVEVEGFR